MSNIPFNHIKDHKRQTTSDFFAVYNNIHSKAQLKEWLEEREYNTYFISNDSSPEQAPLFLLKFDDGQYMDKRGIVRVAHPLAMREVVKMVEQFRIRLDGEEPHQYNYNEEEHVEDDDDEMPGMLPAFVTTIKEEDEDFDRAKMSLADFIDLSPEEKSHLKLLYSQQNQVPKNVDGFDFNVPIPPVRFKMKHKRKSPMKGAKVSRLWKMPVGGSDFFAGTTVAKVHGRFIPQKKEGWKITARTVIEDGIKGVRVWRIV